MQTRDKTYYTSKLTTPINIRQRCWNREIVSRATGDYFRSRTSLVVLLEVIERARVLDVAARWRGVPEPRLSVIVKPLSSSPNLRVVIPTANGEPGRPFVIDEPELPA